MEKLRVILTGATGMVGEGVLHECLLDPKVETVLVIGRRGTGMQHEKLKEVLCADLSDLTSVEAHLSGYNTCLFCIGVSSVGMKEDEYTRLTYTLVMGFAKTLFRIAPGLTFCYISGASTRSDEKGVMWARVKGRTENELLGLFKNAYMFRPGYMQPTKGLKNTLGFYRYVQWMYPFLRLVMSGSVSTLAELGRSMINTAYRGCDKRVLEVKDIVKMAKP